MKSVIPKLAFVKTAKAMNPAAETPPMKRPSRLWGFTVCGEGTVSTNVQSGFNVYE